jgi:hypothetical protein
MAPGGNDRVATLLLLTGIRVVRSSRLPCTSEISPIRSAVRGWLTPAITLTRESPAAPSISQVQ